jgi:hypothetical protein
LKYLPIPVARNENFPVSGRRARGQFKNRGASECFIVLKTCFTIHCLNKNTLVRVLNIFSAVNRLCGLVVRVPGYKAKGPGFDSRHYQIFCVALGLERGPALVRINEELLERKVAAPV